MQFRFAQHLLAVTIFACLMTKQKSPTDSPKDLRVELRSTNPSNRFKVGEAIELEAIFSSEAPRKYLEPCGLFGTGFGIPLCRFSTRWSFSIKPGTGWTDIRGLEPSETGGPMFEVPSHDLSSNPVSYSYMLTDAYRFNEPGEYRVVLTVFGRARRQEHTARTEC